MFGEELLGACTRLDSVIASYPVRGLKGAVGTQLDQLTLFDGDAGKGRRARKPRRRPPRHARRVDNVGQVYPRSLDFRVVAALTDSPRPVLVLQDPAPDGRPRNRQRRFRPGPDRLLRHAAQDELPLLRARQRLPRHPQRLSRDGRRARRRPVERRRRLLLGRPPRDAARRVLRHRRPARNLPHRARPDGRLPGRHRTRKPPTTCRS